MKILANASTAEADRLSGLLPDIIGLDVRRSASRAQTLAIARAWRPHLLIVEPAGEGEELARFIVEAAPHVLCLAFLGTDDARLSRRLPQHTPVAVLPKDYDRGDLRSLLANVRSIADLPAPSDAKPTTGLQGLALLSAIAAAVLGFQLPGGPFLLEPADRGAYCLVAGLALFSFWLLLRLNRPASAAIQAALVALITLAPTQS